MDWFLSQTAQLLLVYQTLRGQGPVCVCAMGTVCLPSLERNRRTEGQFPSNGPEAAGSWTPSLGPHWAPASRPLWLVNPPSEWCVHMAKEKEYLALCSRDSVLKKRQCIVCLRGFHLLSFYLLSVPLHPWGIISLFSSWLPFILQRQTQRHMTFIISFSLHVFLPCSLLYGG